MFCSLSTRLRRLPSRDAFVISNGVKQGCVLAPVLFNVFFTCMLSHDVQDLEKGIYIRYCLDGSLFDLRRLPAKTKSQQTLLREVLFADDCALVTHAQHDLQRILDRFSEASKLFGLIISLGKTEVLYQPTPYSHPLLHHIYIYIYIYRINQKVICLIRLFSIIIFSLLIYQLHKSNIVQ